MDGARSIANGCNIFHIFGKDMAKYRLELVQPNSEYAPLARSGHRCATDGVFLYSFGGFNPDSETLLFDTVIWCFHLSSKTWHELVTDSYGFGRAPRCVASSAMVFHRGEFIVFGGSGYPFGFKNSNGIFFCNPLEQRWHSWSFIPQIGEVVPETGYGQGAVIGPEECLYVFGGTQGTIYNNDLHKFDLGTHRWEQVECRNPPSARYRHEMVGIDGGFLVFGGYGPNGTCSLDKLPVYSYAKCSWTEVKCEEDSDHGLPKPRRAHSCVKYKDNVYICGGYREENLSETLVFNDIWKLNMTTFSWCKISQVLPRATYFHSAAVTSEGCMYIFGGIEVVDEGEEARTNSVHKMWLVIPPLKNRCWEKLCETVPPMARFNTDKLRELGVPQYLLLGYEAQFIVGKDNDLM